MKYIWNRPMYELICFTRVLKLRKHRKNDKKKLSELVGAGKCHYVKFMYAYIL